MKRASLYGLLVLLALVLLTAAASAEPASEWGWNEAKTVYTVIGQNGWEKQIPIEQTCTVDLSRAEDPEGSFYYLFQIKGDNVAVTFTTGNREEPLNLGSSLLFTVDKSSKNPHRHIGCGQYNLQ